jgi:sulfate/thiosulfate transport system permease protein
MSNVIPARLVKPKSAWRKWFDRIRNLSWTWRFTWFYLSAMLFLPLGAMFAKAGSDGWAKFWEVATSPIALSTYDITFTTSLIATLINGLFGTAIAWVLVRYDFPGKRMIDASIDLPFALPTSVAGLTLATVYSDNGWIGSLFAPFGQCYLSHSPLSSVQFNPY